MSLPAFLYRRLARFITCELSLVGPSRIALRSKHDVASFADVFCHPFYWQVFEDTEQTPALVVDLGAHCGHFTLLVDACIRARRARGDTRYILVEPNPKLLRVLERTLGDVGLTRQVTLLPGVVGVAQETATLHVHPKSYLTAGLQPMPGARPVVARRIDLDEALDGANVDIMKVDIEGAEYGLVEQSPTLFRRVRTLFLEMHERSAGDQSALMGSLRAAGLDLVGAPLASGLHRLMLWRRR